MRVLLVPKATGEHYSIEAGLADDKKHFDHHGEYKNFPSPSNNPKIPVLDPDDIVEITHLDADTMLGLMRMSGKPIDKKLDLDLIEQVDTNGSSVLKDKTVPSYLYMVGIFERNKQLGFPRVSKEPQDVTALVYKLLDTPTDVYIELGKEAQAASEKAYKDTLVEKKGNVGLWSVGEKDTLDPSRPYDDGIDIVIVYRKHFKSMSVYCSPKSKYEFGNRDVGGIHFAGHAKAAGSPRGVAVTLDDAKKVFDAVVKEVGAKTASTLRYRGAFYRLVH